jgi:MOSC domain-containing protein YiiM
MHVGSVNVATAPTELRSGSRTLRSGIGKHAADAPVEVGALGLAGDLIVQEKHHGGPDQAVYVYGETDYAWWSERLGRALEPGTFGENLTITELETGAALVGDRMRVGAEVVLEVTAGRIPCNTLTARMGIRGFARDFRKANRPGLYCRVLATGRLGAGDEVRYAAAASPTISVLELSELYYARAPKLEDLERALAAPICERARRECGDQLAALRSP